MKKGITVLSLFDGMSCGRIALDRAGIKVKKYYASEIDKYAQMVSAANYPGIIRLGDIIKWRDWSVEKPDIIIGGSPCQGFSFAGKQLNFNDERSKLFFTFVDILKHYNPKYFLLENVKMKKEYENIISELVGVKPIEINSALVSAQNRKRLYWTNIPNVTQPNDRGVFLRDIIEEAETERDKAFCLDANYHKGATVEQYQKRHRRQLVVCGASRGRNIVHGKRKDEKGAKCKQRIEVRKDEKTNTLTSVQKDNLILNGLHNGWRKLTPLECERLQTVPDNYTNHVSNTQRYKMLGNGWTVDVIAHIFRGLK